MPLEFDSKAQGTIEYLIVMGVVIIIGLVVVSIMMLAGDTRDIATKTDEFGQKVGSGGISIAEVVADVEGDGIISLSNTGTTPITIKSISAGSGGTTNNYSGGIPTGGKATFALADTGCKCTGEEKTKQCTYTITYLTQAGIRKTDTLPITVDCVSDAIASNGTVLQPTDTTAPIVTLSSPIDGYNSASRSVSFSFSTNEVGTCVLRAGSDSNSYTISSSGSNTISYTFANDKLADWNISCTDASNNTGISTTRTIDVDSNAYQITTCLELQDMNLNLTGNYELMNDINCYTATRSGGVLYNGGAGFVPIGTNANPFLGSLNGNNYRISGLAVNSNFSRWAYVGLFGRITGNIYNVGVEGIEVSAFSYVGALAGRSSGIISGSYSTGLVQANKIVGGLVGSFSGIMSDSYSSASVEGYEGTTGGLVGTSSGTISSSYYSGTVNNADVYSYTGGLAGYSSGAISNSYFSGTASSAGDYVGGIVGYSTASISNSHSIGLITSSAYYSYAGGIAGYTSAPISNSYADVNINAISIAGGLVGRQEGSGTISNSYTHGNITVGGYWYSGDAGGLVGQSVASITDSNSTATVTAVSTAGGLVGSGSSSILRCFATGRISAGSASGGLVGYLNNGGSITNSYATGDVNLTGGYAGGLVGRSWTTSSITNSYATGRVYARGDSVGGLVGGCESSVTNCYSTGDVVVTGSYSMAGGLTGYHTAGVMTNSYSTGNVAAYSTVGALTGVSSALIRNSYATGEVTASGNYVGGLIGIKNSNTVTNVWWYNSKTSCCANGTCTSCTKASAASDFFVVTQNVYDSAVPYWTFGFDNNWTAREGNYPILSWQ